MTSAWLQGVWESEDEAELFTEEHQMKGDVMNSLKELGLVGEERRVQNDDRAWAQAQACIQKPPHRAPLFNGAKCCRGGKIIF